MTKKYKTREEWLMEGLKLIVPIFDKAGHKVPSKIRVSCGFPSRNGLGVKKQSIGECWSDKASNGKYFEIFVSPVLNDPIRVLDVLTHEVVHAVVGLEAKHGTPFKRVALSVGLTGKMTATVAGEELTKVLEKVHKTLGAYPHDQLNGMINGKKPDVCRLLKALCPKCGYVVRVTRKWAEEAGLPICPTCNESFELE